MLINIKKNIDNLHICSYVNISSFFNQDDILIGSRFVKADEQLERLKDRVNLYT